MLNLWAAHDPDDPVYIEHLRDLHEHEVELDAAYAKLGPWETHYDLAAHSRPDFEMKSRRAKKAVYRRPAVEHAKMKEMKSNFQRLGPLLIRPEDYE